MKVANSGVQAIIQFPEEGRFGGSPLIRPSATFSPRGEGLYLARGIARLQPETTLHAYIAPRYAAMNAFAACAMAGSE